MAIFTIVAFATLVEWYYGGFSGTPTQLQLSRFVVATLGLNIIHISFTFAMIAGVPELKDWVHKLTNGRPHILWMTAGAIFVSALIVQILLDQVFPIPAWAFSLLVSSIFFFRAHHAISQHLGLGLATIKAQCRNGLDRHTIQRLTAETRLKNGLFLAFAVYACTQNSSSGSENLWLPLQKISLFSIQILIAAIIFNSLLLPKSVRLGKMRFTSRLLLYVFPFNSLAISIGSRFIHSYEYLGVTEQIMSQSVMTRKERWTFLKILLLLCTLGFTLLLFKRTDGIIALAWGVSYDKLPVIFKILGAISMSLGVCHFYFDALMFRMKDPITRAIVSPLLIGKPMLPIPSQIEAQRLRKMEPEAYAAEAAHGP